MNSNTSPLRDESQLTERRIDELWQEAITASYQTDYGTAYHFARLVEAEVRSLRSQEPIAWRAWDDRLYGWVYFDESPELPSAHPLYASPPSQPIASDVVAAPDVLSRHGSVEAESHQSPRNTQGDQP